MHLSLQVNQKLKLIPILNLCRNLSRKEGKVCSAVSFACDLSRRWEHDHGDDLHESSHRLDERMHGWMDEQSQSLVEEASGMDL